MKSRWREVLEGWLVAGKLYYRFLW